MPLSHKFSRKKSYKQIDTYIDPLKNKQGKGEVKKQTYKQLSWFKLLKNFKHLSRDHKHKLNPVNGFTWT